MVLINFPKSYWQKLILTTIQIYQNTYNLPNANFLTTAVFLSH